jgi:hypothetical protein
MKRPSKWSKSEDVRSELVGLKVRKMRSRVDREIEWLLAEKRRLLRGLHDDLEEKQFHARLLFDEDTIPMMNSDLGTQEMIGMVSIVGQIASLLELRVNMKRRRR